MTVQNYLGNAKTNWQSGKSLIATRLSSQSTANDMASHCGLTPMQPHYRVSGTSSQVFLRLLGM
jgi:hypothetical protein